MSWWDTGQQDDVIGDRPADLIGGALKDIARTSADKQLPKPTLESLLRALGLALTTGTGEYLDAHPDLQEIVAEDALGVRVSSGPLRAEPLVPDLTERLRKALHLNAAAYMERWERKPRLTELLATLEFVLGYRPEDFLVDGAEHVVKKLEAVAR